MWHVENRTMWVLTGLSACARHRLRQTVHDGLSISGESFRDRVQGWLASWLDQLHVFDIHIHLRYHDINITIHITYLIFVLSTSVRISESTTKLDLVSDSNHAINDINHLPDHAAVRWKRQRTSKYRQRPAYTRISAGQCRYHDIVRPDKNTITIHRIEFHYNTSRKHAIAIIQSKP
jgi:hypothetical protein